MRLDAKDIGLRWLNWLLWHNPAYLMSAAMMAIGVRCLLVGSSGLPGDVMIIVVTFAVLQVYEWAVGGILLLLDRSGRSPEDKPPLMLVAMLFWTGPLMATIELTVASPGLGTSVAVGAGGLACIELWLAGRLLAIRLARSAYAIAGASLTLLVATPTILRWLTGPSGLSEVALYFAWWTLGGIVLHRAWSGDAGESGGVLAMPAGRRGEMLFLVIVVAAAAGHLVAMNHSFWCHARLFYGAPLLAAVATVAFRGVSRAKKPLSYGGVIAASLPGAAIMVSMQPFSDTVPVEVLPSVLRDPLSTSLLLAALAWWCGARWLRQLPLLHLGSVAIGVVAGRVVMGGAAPMGSIRELSAVYHWAALYVVVGYLLVVSLLVRRRAEAAAAVAVHWLGLSVLSPGGAGMGSMPAWMLAGWSSLLVVHVLSDRPSMWLRLPPILLLTAVSMVYHRDPELAWVARGHAAGMTALLFGVGCFWPWTRYRAVAMGLAASGALYALVDGLVRGVVPMALVVVASSFALLAAGLFVSVKKDLWLGSSRKNDPPAASLERSSVT